MNRLIKRVKDDDGEITHDNQWHLVDPCNPQGAVVLCTQEFFGYEESNLEYELKIRKKGGITCKKCVEIVKGYKSVKL